MSDILFLVKTTSMKKYLLILILIISLPLIITAQYSVGKRTITFNDPTRSGGFGSGGGPGRQIQTEIYYPATAAGNNTPVANGQFPVITFGHGFVMSWDAYQNIWEYFVPYGYIVAFPRTEGNFSPSHNDFALDLRVVNERMKLEGQTVASPFYQKVSNRSAMMGHSMGGGCSMLAAANYNQIDCVIGLAPAETNPSAVTAAASITKPAIVFSGAQDGVTPPAQHHQPIYNALASACKTFVSITGGAHCYFANSNFNCDFGESTSSSGISITRTQQQNITQGLLLPFLNSYLKDSCFQIFQSALQNQSGITHQQSCNYTALVLNGVPTQPTQGNNGSIDVTVNGGTPPYTFNWSNGATTEDLQNLGGGIYTLTVTDAQNCTQQQSFTLNNAPTAIIDYDAYLYKVYPNPVENILFIDGLKNETITLTDCSGRVIISQQAMQVHTQIPISELSKGIYILSIEKAIYKIVKN
jgi:dienelactone hydrolase